MRAIAVQQADRTASASERRYDRRRGEARYPAAAVCGPQVETITSGHGVTFWFNRVEQYRRGVNMMGTLHRMPQLGCRPARFRFYTVPSSSPGLPKQPIAPCPGIGKAT
jgi:hypothetical protein